MTFCLIVSMSVLATTTAFVGCLKYEFEGNSAYIISYDSNIIPEELVIPETVEYNGLTFNVTSIKNYAFLYCTKIKSLKTNHRLSSIGESAFQHCSHLETVDVNADILHTYVFFGCTSLKKAKINTKDINSFGFHGCTNLESLILEGVVDIYNDAFSDCEKLKWIDFGKTLQRIGSNAYGNCISLTNLVFPPTLYLICPTIGTAYFNSDDRYIYPYDCWGGKSSKYYYYYGGKGNLPSSYPLPSTKSPFTGCNFIQSVIYLGDNIVSTGLSNVNTYTRKNMIEWSENSFVYSGKSPSPTFTSNLPIAFQPTSNAAQGNLEKEVGTYSTTMPVTFKNGDMEFTVNIPYKYTVTPATLTARVKNSTKVYGEANPQFQSDYSGFVNGEDKYVITSHGSYSTSATTKSSVGTYSVTQSGAKTQNYTFQYEDGTLTITKASLTMTPRDKTMTYGDRVPNFDVDYKGLKNGETKPEWMTEPTVTTTATQTSNAGTYPITISGGVAKNYEVTYKQGTLTIDKAALTVTTKDATREYGDENPDFELLYDGLKNGETEPAWAVAPTVGSPATKTSPVGVYDITISGGESRNYVVTQYVNKGKLTITKAPLTATARSYTKRQGEDNPIFEVNYIGFKNGETKLVLTKEPIATTTATKNSRPGTYPITLSDGVAMNYDLTYVNGTLTILPVDDPGNMTDNTLSIDNIKGSRNAQTILPIALKNKHAITGFQIDLYLPEGIGVATKSNGKMMISTTNRMTGDYTITGSQMDGFVRIVGYSGESEAFTGNDGDILNVTLDISSSVLDGDYTIRLKDIVLSDVNNTEYHPADVGARITVSTYTLGDVDNSGAVNINDVVCIINYILNKANGVFIEDAADVDGSGTININDVVTLINRYILKRSNARAEMARIATRGAEENNYLHLDQIDMDPGEMKEVELLLTNTGTVAAAQGNIKLPEGLSFVMKSNGRVDVSNIDSRAEGFTLSCALQEDGSLTFAQYSPDGFTYDGNSGGILKFKIKAADDAKPGNYEIMLSDVVLSVNGVGVDIPNRMSVLHIIGGEADSKVETPTISYHNGELTFSCATDGVEYVYEITDSDIKTGFDSKVQLSVTYNISVYATKDGYEKSDIATATLCWIDANPKAEGIDNSIAQVRARAVMIQNRGSKLIISGTEEGEEISVYDTAGRKVGTARADDETTIIPTSLHNGSVAIVKIGQRTVKVMMK